MGCSKSKVTKFVEDEEVEFRSRVIIPDSGMVMNIGIGDAPCRVFFIPSIEGGEERWMMVDTGFYTQYDDIKNFIENNDHGITKENLEYIVCTHAHLDHVGNVNKLKELTNATVIISDYEAKFLEKGENSDLILRGILNKVIFGIIDCFVPQGYEAYQIDRDEDIVLESEKLKDEDFLLGDFGVRVLFLPGHTPGQIGVYLEDTKELIPGDLVVSNMAQDNLGASPYCSSETDRFESYLKIHKLGFKRLYSHHFVHAVDFRVFEDVFRDQFFKNLKKK